MKVKKIIAVILALVTVFALVGCGKSRRPIVKLTLSTEDAIAILAAAGIRLPDVEEVTCAGTTVTWYSWADRFHNYSEEEIVNSGYWVFSEKYGCEIEWRECLWANRFTDLANYVISNKSPDFYPLSTEIFPNYVMKELFQPVNDYIDYSDPLWAGTVDLAKTYLSLGDNIYGFVTGSSAANPVVYNRRVMEENGYDDPAELYRNGDWTWDVFLEMCIDFSDADIEKYALDGWWYDNAIMESTGTDIVTYDVEKGEFVENLDDPRLERAAGIIEELKKNECMYPVWAHNWTARGDGTTGNGLKDGQTLFWVVAALVEITAPVEEMAEIWGDMTNQEIMFVPMPRDPDGDGKHYVTTAPSGYALVEGAKNPEGVGLLAACDRFKALDPTVKAFDKREKMNKYLWTEEMFEMQLEFERLKEEEGNVVVPYDKGIGDKLDSIVNKTKELGRKDKPTSWAQVKESFKEQLEYYVDEWNYEVEEYENKLINGEE